MSLLLLLLQDSTNFKLNFFLFHKVVINNCIISAKQRQT